MLKTRILLGLVLIGALTGIMWFDHMMHDWHGFLLILAVVTFGGLFEYAQLVSRADLWLPPRLLALSGTAILLTVALTGTNAQKWGLPVAALVTVLFLSEGVFLGNVARCEAAALALGGLVYIVFLSLFVVWLRQIEPYGEVAFYWFIAVNKGTDMGAFFTGKSIGRHKLCPAVSPGKTWEGSVGGTILGSVIGLLIWRYSALHAAFPWWSIALAALPVSISGQVGDLTESLFKRRASVKDSSTLLPQFGGFLDLTDCLLLSAPFAYYALLWMPKI